MIIDGELMESKDALYAHLNRVFAFPLDFGNNLDALWDALNEENEKTTIEFVHTNKAIDYLGDYGERLIELLKKLEKENEHYKIRFL